MRPRAWVGPGGQGCWKVSAYQYENLWKQADWQTRQINDPKRAAKEWANLYNTEISQPEWKILDFLNGRGLNPFAKRSSL
jgi:hypothetical protein